MATEKKKTYAELEARLLKFEQFANLYLDLADATEDELCTDVEDAIDELRILVNRPKEVSVKLTVDLDNIELAKGDNPRSIHSYYITVTDDNGEELYSGVPDEVQIKD